MKIIVLAGGGGTRLFPLSTEDKPKQFLKLFNEKSMLMNTIERFEGLCRDEDIVIVTNAKYKPITQEELKNNGKTKVHILTEPARKNTAPAIMLAIKFLIEEAGAHHNETIIAVPSDHVIEPVEKLIQTIRLCEKETNKGRIATIGVIPAYPETGYGYIEAAEKNVEASKVKSFHEKPDIEKAKKYLKDGNYYWNAGIYCFTAKSFQNEINKTSPDLGKMLNLPYPKLLNEFQNISSISIDCALSEKSDNMSVVTMLAKWSDIGAWKAYYDYMPKDKDGNVIIGNVESSGCNNSLFISLNGYLKIKDQNNVAIVSSENNTIVINL